MAKTPSTSTLNLTLKYSFRVLTAAFVAATALTLTGCENLLTNPAQTIQRVSDSAPALAPAEPTLDTSTCEGAIRAIWQKDIPWAIAISRRESHLDPKARNRRSSASGCFQLLRLHSDLVPGGWGARYDAAANVTAAWRLYCGSGRSPWKSRRH